MKNINILIVEDELLIAENLAMKLETLDYNVIDIVSSGKAAIKKVNAQSPGLILMDIAIKGNMDGIQTAEVIRANHDIPIIFLTAYADDKTLDRASKTGCYGYILKPFKDRELHATIKMALSKHQEQTAICDSLQATISEYSVKNHNTNIDSLTQLPNQFFLRDLFEYFLSEHDNASASKIQKSENQPSNVEENQKLLAIICFSIDRFERIQHSLGNENRDLLIKAVVEKLTECTEYFQDKSTSAIVRLQNDRFAILLSEIKQKVVATDFANLVLERLQSSFLIDNCELFLTASMGISFYNDEKLGIDLLLNQAQKAMKYAQQQGGNKYKLHTLSLDMIVSDNSNNISLETDLHYALKRQELELYYQPKISLKTGKIAGVEALIRWNHPKLGLIAPNKFISIAEASSLIEPLGEWVLETACKQTKIWHQAGFNFLSVAVNLSGRQFKQLDLFHRLTKIIFDSTLEPEFLELELTEQILVDNVKRNIQRLNFIKKLGIKISLDDFGTGYSSLGYLQQFPFDIIKINQCFVENIDRNSKNAIIAKSIIEMAHQLELKVVAEGIETEAELEFLAKDQCDEVQGNLLSRPLPVKEFSKLLLKNQDFTIVNPESIAAY
ncbi:Response regulator receiver modulated diguanylate cyclase/phosphodiesterase [Hyella patelloides LEGE 07179]|uniref:Response regulator receiver modulated diguanylate cyclase/phosphodiesterase n=1 Tax=Hyella patelloides LEGE 07179 TaxID=945734 RepID=A0A563VSL2_9CYAN|nr:EAL domain-containing protein [Hyella patelloides]VEP14376.1 Response regulator receiver modulated diguanylate cyclase/phosphodiesterase [Hyella patelloides LEGE 07179]